MRKTFFISILLYLAVVASIGGKPARPAFVADAGAAAAAKADAPTLTLPKTKTVKVGRTFYICPQTNCTAIKWIIPNGLEQDTEIVLKDKLAVALVGDSAGVYAVSCYGTLGDVLTDPAICTVTIGTPPPPVPPTPPTPPSPLTAALQAGYSLDTDADKAASLEFLQQVYAGMVPLVPTWTDVKTNGDALATLKVVIDSPNGLKPTQVVNLRKAIAADFAAKFGTAANTPIDLTALAAELTAVATALKGVK
jgi:hypothetical protein